MRLPMVSLYADDTSVIVSSDVAIRAVFFVYSRFEHGTGSKLNLDKCRGLWLVVWRGRHHSPVTIQWSSDKVKILGVSVGHGDLAMANWLPRLETVEKCLASWKGRALSFSGKAVVLNALALFRIWYVASLVHLPPWVLTRLNSAIFNFFWAGKREQCSTSAKKRWWLLSSLRAFGPVGQRLDVCPNRWVYLLTY